MQEQIYVVVPSGVQLKKLVIQGVRQPSQRMPVGLIVGRERPLDRVPVQTSLHVRVVGDVNRVVVVDERVMIYRIVEREGRGHQQKTQDPCPRLDPMQPPMVGPVPSPHRRCQTNRSHSCSLISRIISDQLFEELVMTGLGCKIPATSPVPTRRSYRWCCRLSAAAKHS